MDSLVRQISSEMVAKAISDATSEAATTEQSQVCKFFQKGTCRFSSECRFVHNTSDAVREQQELRPKGQRKDSAKSREEGTQGEKKPPMRTASDVVKRIQWDPSLRSELFTVGYEDRFVGLVEKKFDVFDWRDFDSLSHMATAIPKHRITYFKYRDLIVWDKRIRLDNIYGSTGGKLLVEVISEYDEKHGPPKDDEDAQDEDEDEIAQAEEVRRKFLRRRKEMASRPNFFLCLRVNNPAVVAAAQDVQDSIKSYDARLESAMTALDALHFTMLTMRLDTPTEISTAKEILQNCQELLQKFTPRHLPLHVEGLGCFRERVVFAKLREDDETRVGLLVKALGERFSAAGIRLTGTHPVFKAHMTLAKMNRNLIQEVHHIDEEAFAEAKDQVFGAQVLEGLHLCHMIAAKEDDGFYNKLSSVYNTAPARTIEDCLQVAQFVGEDHLPLPASKRVVVMRGLPGSGKSSMIRSLETLHIPTKICSADHFFINDEGQYNFDMTKLGNAHAACKEHFLEALAVDVPLVIVDNTNSKHAEYKSYEKFATEYGYVVTIFEIQCATREVLKEFQGRNSHNVPLASMERMYDRWEADERAILVAPWMPKATPKPTTLSLGQPKNDNQGASVKYAGLFLSKESRMQLLEAVKPKFSKTIADHVTLCYSPSTAVLATLPFGKKFTIQVTAHKSNQQIHAAIVSLPDELRSTNLIPHITVSLVDGVAPSESTGMIQTAREAVEMKTPLTLTGVVGVVYKSASGKTSRCLSRQLLAEVSHSTYAPQSGQYIQELNVFDFDQTLFNTPSRDAFFEVTGHSWPHRTWVKHPESLTSVASKITPGPVYPLFTAFSGRSNALCIVLTGRCEALRKEVSDVIDRHGLSIDKLLLKPRPQDSTKQFKVAALRKLLLEYPSVHRIRMFDDDESNLSALQEFKHEIEDEDDRVEIKIINAIAKGAKLTKLRIQQPWGTSCVGEYLFERGMIMRDAYRINGTEGLQFITSVWVKVLGQFGGEVGKWCSVAALSNIKDGCNPKHLSYPFGSFPLGRPSDLDVCLLGPDTMTHWEAVRFLETELRNHGVVFLYAADSSRCPRLKVRLEFTTSSPVEFDIVFALYPPSRFQSILQERIASTGEINPVRLNALLLEQAGSPSASKSQIALSGLSFLQKVETVLKAKNVTTAVFALAVEMVKLMFQWGNISGNAFRAIRTFHVVKLLTKSISAAIPSQVVTHTDELVRCFFHYTAGFEESNWLTLFEEGGVPKEFAADAVAFVRFVDKLLSSKGVTMEALNEIYETYRKSPPATDTITVKYHANDRALLFQLDAFIHARMGACIQRILLRNVKVTPDSLWTANRGGSLRFSIPIGQEPRKVVTEELQGMWRELQFYCTQGADVTAFVGDNPSPLLDSKSTASMDDSVETSMLIQLVDEFLAGEETELHCPTTLSSYERKILHSLADNKGLAHDSTGDGDSRHIVLKKR